MNEHIESVSALESVIGKTPPPVKLKVIDHLDAHALRWIATSSLVFASFCDATSIALTLGGGQPGFVTAQRDLLQLPLAALDDPALARPGQSFGSLFLLSGLRETLRVNGRVADVAGGCVTVVVEECYLHCAKALIRSEFWATGPREHVYESSDEFVHATRFLALGTVDAQGRADISPKGDPAGCTTQVHHGTLSFADRPGNRRVDSFRNIIAQPKIAAALIVPGCQQVAILRGTARLTRNADACTRFTVQGKTPHLVTQIADPQITLYHSEALVRAGQWLSHVHVESIDPARIFAAHVRLNKDKGLAARIAGAVVSVPGLMRKGLEKDYESNLY
jgi:predicted pyridoxine 5'-phosphate oxidase superfamily flavin-nucleotide-binding protein